VLSLEKKMKDAKYFKYDKINEKLDFLIKMAWELLQKKAQYNFIEMNKEASLQLQYANILQSLISTSRYSDEEIVKVALEKTIYIQNKKPQEADLILETKVDNQPYIIAIEMKCYRRRTSSDRSRGAMDIFVKDVYEDIEVLENYKLTNKDIKKTYFLAMTDHLNFVLPKYKSAKYWDYDISDGFIPFVIFSWIDSAIQANSSWRLGSADSVTWLLASLVCACNCLFISIDVSRRPLA